MMITKLLKNLFSKAETLSSEAEQNAKDYTDLAVTKRAWDVTPLSGVTFYNNVQVCNGVAFGQFRFNFTATSSGWKQIGTVVDVPPGDEHGNPGVDIAVPIINLAQASCFGELQVRRDGTLYVYYSGAYSGDAATTICYVLGGGN